MLFLLITWLSFLLISHEVSCNNHFFMCFLLSIFRRYLFRWNQILIFVHNVSSYDVTTICNAKATEFASKFMKLPLPTKLFLVGGLFRVYEKNFTYMKFPLRLSNKGSRLNPWFRHFTSHLSFIHLCISIIKEFWIYYDLGIHP